jgi:hypothetical protein
MAKNKITNLSQIEKEVIFLKAVYELINSMVNYEIMDLADASVVFKSMTHQMYFNVILVDFLSHSDKRIIGEEQTYLEAVTLICKNPNFNENGSANGLTLAIKDFVEWLDQEIQVETWLPTIDTNVHLAIKRTQFIKICGNISKHNFSRLSVTANELLEILGKNKIKIELEDVLVLLKDFYEKFHFDVLSSHASIICEFLNNVRWGIYEYLKPEFDHSIVYEGGNPPMYRFTYPKGIINKFAKNCYWDLMNEIRSRPYMPKFQVPDWIKDGLKDTYILSV